MWRFVMLRMKLWKWYFKSLCKYHLILNSVYIINVLVLFVIGWIHDFRLYCNIKYKNTLHPDFQKNEKYLKRNSRGRSFTILRRNQFKLCPSHPHFSHLLFLLARSYQNNWGCEIHLEIELLSFSKANAFTEANKPSVATISSVIMGKSKSKHMGCALKLKKSDYFSFCQDVFFFLS